jgi:hypothetical protein
MSFIKITNVIGTITAEILLFFKDPVVLIVIPVLVLSVLLDKCGVSL